MRGNVAAATLAPLSDSQLADLERLYDERIRAARARPLVTRPSPKGPPLLRTHDAGTLRASDAGSTVTLAGWVARRRDHGGVVFLDLRDASGYVQVVVREEEAHALRNEYCVLVTGEVRRRPEGNENAELPTGEIEVATTDAAGALGRRRRCRSRSRPTRPPGTTSATRTATSTCAGRVRRRRSGCARRSTGSPAGSWPSTASSRSRRRT